MDKRLLLYALLMASSLAAIGQTVSGIVRDMETKKPIKDVEIIVNGSYANTVKTDYRGHFAIGDSVSCLTFIRYGYEKRMLTRAELTDTVEMLTGVNRVGEVVIYGKKPWTHMPVMDLVRKEFGNAPKQPQTSIGGGFNFFSFLSVFEKGHVSAKKRRERMKALENY